MIEGRIEVTEGKGSRHKQLLDDLRDKRNYWKFKEYALDGTLLRIGFGRGCRPVARHTTV
jgi:hypothetical protein